MDAQRAQQEQQAAGSASSDAPPWATALHSLPQLPGDSTVLGPRWNAGTACCGCVLANRLLSPVLHSTPCSAAATCCQLPNSGLLTSVQAQPGPACHRAGSWRRSWQRRRQLRR